MGLIDTSLEVLKLASKIANPELVQAATRANIEALELSSKNLELRQAPRHIGTTSTQDSRGSHDFSEATAKKCVRFSVLES
jgi:hypothetical protein